jgi:aspartyl-tRNA(Asn)/glutamyl-tRNA(Gln) amidotransferase subunit B
MNSFKGLQKALEYEAMRQEDVLRSGGTILQQTFLWDPSTNRSVPMRSKEDAHDYRYFPEPDLMPLIIESSWIESLRSTLPELPAARRKRFETQYGLPTYQSEVLTSSAEIADYFEEVLKTFSDARQVSNWVMGDILRILNDQKISTDKLRVTPSRLGTLLQLIKDGAVSDRAAKKVIDTIQAEDKDPAVIIDELGLKQVSDSGTLEAAVKKVIDEHPGEVQRYKAGEKKLMGFFVGQAMKATAGAGNPREINNIVTRLLG